MEELLSVLGRERVQLEFLLFKILQLQHLLRSQDQRFLRWATEEIARAGQRVHVTEIDRLDLIRQFARSAGMQADEVTLATLAEHAPEPWSTIFADHSLGFRRLAVEVDAVMTVTCALADATGHVIAETLRQIYRPAAMVIAMPRDPSDHPTRHTEPS